jgi:hypothetical protein
LYDVENAIDAALESERWLGKKVAGKPHHPGLGGPGLESSATTPVVR